MGKGGRRVKDNVPYLIPSVQSVPSVANQSATLLL